MEKAERERVAVEQEEKTPLQTRTCVDASRRSSTRNRKQQAKLIGFRI